MRTWFIIYLLPNCCPSIIYLRELSMMGRSCACHFRVTLILFILLCWIFWSLLNFFIILIAIILVLFNLILHSLLWFILLLINYLRFVSSFLAFQGLLDVLIILWSIIFNSIWPSFDCLWGNSLFWDNFIILQGVTRADFLSSLLLLLLNIGFSFLDFSWCTAPALAFRDWAATHPAEFPSFRVRSPLQASSVHAIN